MGESLSTHIVQSVCLVHSLINYTAVASVVDNAERPTHKSQLASKTLPSRPSQTPSLRPLQHSNPSFLKALKNSCHVGVVSQHLLQPLQPQPQFGPQTWLQP